MNKYNNWHSKYLAVDLSVNGNGDIDCIISEKESGYYGKLVFGKADSEEKIVERIGREIYSWIPLMRDETSPIEGEANNIDIEWANAECTGGGIYAYIGKLKNGNYFMAADDWNNDKCYVYEVDSEVSFDAFDETDPAPWSNEWIDEHLVSEYHGEAFAQILRWIIANKPEGNYSEAELKKGILDARRTKWI